MGRNLSPMPLPAIVPYLPAQPAACLAASLPAHICLPPPGPAPTATSAILQAEGPGAQVDACQPQQGTEGGRGGGAGWVPLLLLLPLVVALAAAAAAAAAPPPAAGAGAAAGPTLPLEHGMSAHTLTLTNHPSAVLPPLLQAPPPSRLCCAAKGLCGSPIPTPPPSTGATRGSTLRSGTRGNGELALVLLSWRLCC
jgi:hypothetical protein